MFVRQLESIAIIGIPKCHVKETKVVLRLGQIVWAFLAGHGRRDRYEAGPHQNIHAMTPNDVHMTHPHACKTRRDGKKGLT